MGFEIVLLLGLATAYVTKCLVLEEKHSHIGPFLLKDTFILFPESGHIQEAALFDLIRRVFGAYELSDESNDFQTVWAVHPHRSERFTCPFCLSFWTAALFSIPFMWLFQIDPILLPVVHFAIASLSTLFVGALNYALQV